MSVVTQLNPPLYLETPKGCGWCHLVIDYSQDHHLMWVVFIDATRECWTFENTDIKIAHNPSMGV
jgi:hypothetical protein